MIPEMTASGVCEDGELLGQQPEVLERPEHDAAVAQDDLPADGPKQEAREERCDDEEQQQVLVAAAAEGDRIGERVRDREGQEGRRAAVQRRTV